MLFLNENGNLAHWNGSMWNPWFSAERPRARNFAGMAFDSHRRRVVLFGGRVGGQTVDELWEKPVD